MQSEDELRALKSENARLIELLESHQIEWRLPPEPIPLPTPDIEHSRFSPQEKVALFRHLFRGRTDVFPIRWESKTTGKVGYTPACANEWKAGVCNKPRIKCSDCTHRLLRQLAIDENRTMAIAAQIEDSFSQGRKVLVLTERTEHLDAIQAALFEKIPALFVLQGRMTKKLRSTLIAELNALPPDEPRVLLATGKLVGEGFDHPPLDTLVLAMPISWTGTLQQYAGRLHREHTTKTDVKVIDFVDTGHPALVRMWEERQRGYRAMGYKINE